MLKENLIVKPSWQEEVQKAASHIRYRVLEHTIKSNGGYMSQACSSAEIFATLYMRIMNLGQSLAPLIPPPFSGCPRSDNLNYRTGGLYNGPKTPELDRFIFSPSHYALVLYATLIETGRMDPAGLEQFNQDGSTVEMIGAEHSPGCEITSGSLGIGISQAVGIAMARKRKGETGRVFVFLSDGEMQEGQTWEAVASMSFYGLDNMLIYIDVNGQCCDGKMKDVMTIEPLQQRLEAFGGNVFCVSAHNPAELLEPTKRPPSGKSTFVLCYSNPTQGLDLLNSRAPKLHYLRFKDSIERDLYQAELDRMKAAI